MKTYNIHVTSNSDVFHLSFTASGNDFNQAYWVFSAACSNIVSGFGDAKSSKLYRAMEEAVKSGNGSMAYKYQGTNVEIKVDVQ